MQTGSAFLPLPLPLCLAIAVAIGAPSAAWAQDADATATELDEVVVTATRTRVALEDSLAPSEVIDRAEIERSQARSLPELLRGRAGIGLSNQGGAGKLTTVNIRGTESDHVLVLVDGVRIGSASAGLTAFQDLPVDQIERIEIVRGPRSSLYGSDAIGGVIQIFTRGGDKGGLQRNLRLGIGSHNLREAGGGFRYGGERGWISAQAAYQETDGFNACRGAGFPVFQGCFTDEPDRDGYRNTSLSLRGGVAVTDALDLEAHLLDASNFGEYDSSSFGGNEGDNLQRVAGGKATWRPSSRVTLTAQAGRADDQSDNDYVDPLTGTRMFANRFDTRRDSASLQADIALSQAHLLTLGTDWLEDSLDSDPEFLVDERDNTGVFVEYQGRFGAHRVQASARSDDNEQFGSHTTGNLGYGLAFGRGFRFTANVGTGFKAPTFNDLYYPFFGNPGLRPEESESLDLGIAQSGDNWRWALNAYETRIDDLISYDASIFLPNNIEQARIRGAELTGALSIAGWDIAGQVSHTDPRNDTAGPNHGNLLARRARNNARVDVDRAFGDFRFGVTANGSSHRYDDAANTVRLGGYGTLDVRLEYAFTPNWTLQVRAGNVFDRRYETIAWYNQAGRDYGLSLRYASTR